MMSCRYVRTSVRSTLRLRLLTYNIHKCIGGLDRRYDPVRVAHVIGRYEPDFVLLQEVDQHTLRSNADRQVDLLGDILGYRHRVYFPNVRIRGGGDYGNAILSRFPATETVNIDLTVPPKKRRSVLHARYRIRFNGARDKKSRTLHVYNMHLGLSGIERRIQLRKFLESHPFIGLHHRTPIIVAGDFNDVWGTLGRKLLAPAGFRALGRPQRTFPAWGPIRSLDSVYVRGDVELSNLYPGRLTLARRASDHLPLVAELEIP
ncbi:MAG TPA: endonuclease/exonuclease/phosphatase family protein [Vicinamibacteria bacterium]|nr:endonuclease/exonuclease/phosphatase family protein [Vicinamibacteria bacterium]